MKGMLAWMIGCWKIYGMPSKPSIFFGNEVDCPSAGAINIPNLAEPYSAVCSGLTGLLFSGIITVAVSLMS